VPRTNRVSPSDAFGSWQRRFADLAKRGPSHPLHARLGEFEPCLICGVFRSLSPEVRKSRPDLEDLTERVEKSECILRRVLTYAGTKADHVMALMWWYWATMRALWKAERITLAKVEVARNGSLIHGSKKEEKMLRELSPRMRTRRSRARKRANPGSLRVFSYAAPFSGVGTVAIRQSAKFQVAADAHGVLTDEGSVTPVRKRGRPSLADDPLRLVPLTVASLLHQWCPWQSPRLGGRGYLSWSVIGTILHSFTPPGPSLGVGTSDSLMREVRVYRDDPTLRALVRSLDQELTPAIIRALGIR
jgi:hypothetical protein